MNKQQDLSHLWAGHPSADIQQTREAKRQAPSFTIGSIGSVAGNVVILGEANTRDVMAILGAAREVKQ